MIEIENLSFAYPDGRSALHDVSLRVESGETVGLIGPNGAGKSTLLMHLNGLLGLPRQEGTISIDDLVLGEDALPEIRRRVGFVFQDPDDQLFSASVEEDVAFGPQQLGLSANEVNSRVTKALAAVQLSGFQKRIPHHLSLGEKKRACLAGVLACQPKILLFDEPTSGFDPRGRREFIELCQSLPATKLIASHDLEMILALCSRVFVLDAGRLIAEGSTEKILSDEPLMLAHGLEKPHSLFHRHPHPPIDRGTGLH